MSARPGKNSLTNQASLLASVAVVGRRDRREESTVDKVYDQLIEAVEKIVNGPGSWREKKAALLAYVNDNAGSEFGEFVDWLKDVDPDDV